MDIIKYVGIKIKHLRLARSLSQQQLADMLGTTKQAISRYELGQRTANQDILFELSKVFNVSVNEFFPDGSAERDANLKNMIFEQNKIIDSQAELIKKQGDLIETLLKKLKETK